MPSPLGHALGGAIVALAMAPRTHRTNPPHPIHPTYLTWCVVAGCLPDIDFFWGRHNAETHSLGFAVLVGAAVMAFGRAPRLAVACALAVGSHVLFDWLGSDDFPPLGVMALWPLTSQYYFADAFVFDAISRRYHLAGFWRQNLLAVVKEIVMLAPIAALLYWSRRRTSQRDQGDRGERLTGRSGRSRRRAHREIGKIGEKRSPP